MSIVPRVFVGLDRKAGTYFLDYRTLEGRRKRPRVSSDYNEAEKIAHEFSHMLRKGINPEQLMDRSMPPTDLSDLRNELNQIKVTLKAILDFLVQAQEGSGKKE